MKKSWHIPKTQFGRNLLDTIPKKVANLIRVYGLKDKRGRHGNVSWVLSGPGRSILIDGLGALHWSSTAVKAKDVRFFPNAATEWIEDIETNLDRFVQLEKEIYEAVEQFCARRQQEERDISALKAAASH